METLPALGFSHFLAQTDGIGKAILFVLVAMSICTWYVIVVKAIGRLGARRVADRVLERFHSARSPKALAQALTEHANDDPFSNVARYALAAARHEQAPEFLMRSIRRALDEEAARLQSGLTVLASIGSTAPFIGLLGTVWGVYQALISIGISGQGTLDKVAGPVGEALIMTGLGLAVAIPAVLAYNFAVRSNRALIARLDAFAHDAYTLITTGSHISRDASERVPKAHLAQEAA